jgi:hypothetical protein
MMDTLTPERLYLYHRELVKKCEALETRVQVLEHFVMMKFPEYFAGEARTVTDPDLAPVVIDARTLNAEFISPAEATGERERANNEHTKQ